MKFRCLGHMDEKKSEVMSKAEQDAMIEECFAYDEMLLKNRHWVNGRVVLQSARTARALRWKDGKVVVTDGPYAETKEQLGGLGVLKRLTWTTRSSVCQDIRAFVSAGRLRSARSMKSSTLAGRSGSKVLDDSSQLEA